jgi:hypothetical protein
MENDLSNESNQYKNLAENIEISKKGLFRYIIKAKVNGNPNLEDSDSVSTHKNSADSLNSLNSSPEKEIPFSDRSNNPNSKINFTNIYLEETKKRKDNFGREIKKGGKHKIAFADDLDLIKSLTPENNRENNFRKYMRNKNYSSEKNLKKIFSNEKANKRSNSFSNDRNKMMKNLYNISKVKTKSKKKFNESLVHIIKVEKFKEENKLNTFSFKNRNPMAEEENVSCSCYCSIW